MATDLTEAAETLKKLASQLGALAMTSAKVASACEAMLFAERDAANTKARVEALRKQEATLTAEVAARKAAAEKEKDVSAADVRNVKAGHAALREAEGTKTDEIVRQLKAKVEVAKAEVVAAEAAARDNIVDLKRRLADERAALTKSHDAYMKSAAADKAAMMGAIARLNSELSALKAKFSPLMA